MTRYVTKSSGEQEQFSCEKFERSLYKAGASPAVTNTLLNEILVHPELDTTQKIYDYAFKHLRDLNRPLAARYSLKNALYELGPEGFLFERFMAELFKAQGYRTQNDVIVPGICVDHEVDIIMEKNEKRFMAECKFHNRRGLKTDVKVALYIKARFLDLSAQWEQAKEPKLPCDGVWLLTNTQLTTDAIAYGTCAGLNLLAWDYPEEGNIAQLIDTLGLHPITSMTTLTSPQKHFLLVHNVLLARELLEHSYLLKEIGLLPSKIKESTDEAQALCNLPLSYTLL